MVPKAAAELKSLGQSALGLILTVTGTVAVVLKTIFGPTRQRRSVSSNVPQNREAAQPDPTFARKQFVPQPSAGRVSRHAGWFSRLRSLASCLIGPAGVLIMFVAISGAYREEWRKLISPDSAMKSAKAKKPPETPAKPSKVVSVGFANPKQASHVETNRPKWIAEGDKTDGDVNHFVLSSELWSTEEEANQVLKAKAAQIVQADFDSRRLGPFDPRGQQIFNTQRVIDVAVKNEFVEQVDQNFGKFSTPMTRIWWQLELSPLVRTELYSDWKTAANQNKTIFIGFVMACATLIANVVGLFARPEGSTYGRGAQVFN
jgi:hypothetical protein